MTKNSLITLYCIVDDFIHRFLETSAEKKNLALYYGRREPKRRSKFQHFFRNYLRKNDFLKYFSTLFK